jgi:pantoate--beta-alanine ligase
MQILEEISKIDDFLLKIRKKKGKIALIPTMGSIHKGHLSLIKESKKLGFFSIVTIFVNPTQFNDSKDFDKYPRNRDNDIKCLASNDTDLLIFPSIKELYPIKIQSIKTILDYRNILCDKFRPGHFDGVTTVVNLLFKMIKPDHVFFGEKDYQQLKIIEKLIEKKRFPIKIHYCKSIRLPNGISFSSRYKNFTLSQEIILNNSSIQILKIVQKLKKEIDFKIVDGLKKILNKIDVIKVDYIEVRDELTLMTTHNKKNARLFISFYIEDIRIIDNFILY